MSIRYIKKALKKGFVDWGVLRGPDRRYLRLNYYTHMSFHKNGFIVYNYCYEGFHMAFPWKGLKVYNKDVFTSFRLL